MSASVSAWLMAIDSWPTLAQWAFKGCLALTVGAGVAAALSALRASADVRHRAWAAALLAALLLPGFAAALPAWSPAWMAAASPEAAAAPAVVAFVPTEKSTSATPATEPAVAATSGERVDASDISSAAPAVAAAQSSFSWLRLLAVVWLLGAVLSLAPVAAGLISLARLGRRASRTTSPRLTAALLRAQRDLDMQRPVRLWMSGERSMPMTWGWLRPVVLLPADAELWTDARLHAVFAHELAHVERRDPLVRLVAQLARAAYWFYPLAHVALRQLEREQEFACDDRALNAGQRPAEYAEHLLAVASARSTIRFAPSAALAMAQPGRLERRLQAVLDPRLPRRPAAGYQRRLGLAVAALVSIGLATVQGARVSAADEKPADEAEQAVDFEQLRARVLDRYVSRPDERKLLGGAIRGMLQALDDPYTAYLPPEAWNELQTHVRGELAGIGAALEAKDGKVFIQRLLPGSAAAGAGLEAGDQIVSVDGQPADAADLRSVAQAIRGAVGSAVTLRVARSGQPEREVRVVRAAIALARDSVRGYARAEDGAWLYWLDPERKIAFVSIREFTPGLAAELRSRLTALEAEGMRGLVIDLRACPGGVADEALDVARLFAKQDAVLASFRTRSEETKVFQAEGNGSFAGLPLVVLIDEHTASAAELLAGFLAEQAAAELVGVRTLGKGSVQELAELGQGLGGVRLTIGAYRLPSGREVQRTAQGTNWGVDPTPGNYVPVAAEATEALQKLIVQGQAPQTPAKIAASTADPQLAAALTALSGRLDTGRFTPAGKPLPEAAALSAERRQQAEARRRAVEAELEKLKAELEQLQAALP
ncbi:MAG: M56 family metallopeptidase [Pirellulales bacterium]